MNSTLVAIFGDLAIVSHSAQDESISLTNFISAGHLITFRGHAAIVIAMDCRNFILPLYTVKNRINIQRPQPSVMT